MALTPEQLSALEALRRELQQSNAALERSIATLNRGQPLPRWESILSEQSIIANTLAATQETIAEHRDFLTSLHAYPTTKFPGATQQGLLEMLMQKKLAPRTEDWVIKYSKPTAKGTDGLVGEEGGGEHGKKDLDDEALFDLWSHAGVVINGMVDQAKDGDGDDEDQSEDEAESGEDEMMEDVMPDAAKKPLASEDYNMKDVDPSLKPMPMETLLRFMHTGALPPQR